MSFFFVLSGAVTLSALAGGTRGYYWRRLVGLAPTYWFMLALSGWSYHDVDEGVFWYSWTSSMLAVQAWIPTAGCGRSMLWVHDGPAWFVSALVPLILVAPFIAKRVQQWNLLPTVSAAFLLCALRSVPALVMMHGSWYDSDATYAEHAWDARAVYVFPPVRLVEFVD